MKVSELSGDLLNAWVAKALGHHVATIKQGDVVCGYQLYYFSGDTPPLPDYCSDWSEGGPIIERECIDLQALGIGSWAATHCNDQMIVSRTKGATPLVAAMRSYIATKFGEEIPFENISHEGL